jgi:hypothetical protein
MIVALQVSPVVKEPAVAARRFSRKAEKMRWQRPLFSIERRVSDYSVQGLSIYYLSCTS